VVQRCDRQQAAAPIQGHPAEQDEGGWPRRATRRSPMANGSGQPVDGKSGLGRPRRGNAPICGSGT
jgi:hypothetical protein